jgi:hypothetical protein
MPYGEVSERIAALTEQVAVARAMLNGERAHHAHRAREPERSSERPTPRCPRAPACRRRPSELHQPCGVVCR